MVQTNTKKVIKIDAVKKKTNANHDIFIALSFPDLPVNIKHVVAEESLEFSVGGEEWEKVQYQTLHIPNTVL